MTLFSILQRQFAATAKSLSSVADVVFAPRRLVAAPVFAGVLCVGLLPLAAWSNQFVKLDYNLTLSNRSRDTVFIELFDDRPLTRDNFMQYVNAGLYDGTFMHRLIPDFVIQGGGFYPHFLTEPAPLNVSLDPTAEVDLDGNFATANPTVLNEFGNSPFRSNATGTLAMAKVPPPTGGPNSATNEWFVNLKNNAGTAPNGLDFQNGGFTVFAEVRGDGMALFDAFNTLNTDDLNPDFDDDGSRDNFAFTDVPFLSNNLVVLENADRVDYYGNTGSSTTLNFPAAGYTISTRDVFFDTGTLFTGTGSLSIGAGRTLSTREGITLNRSVNNAGTLAPGLKNATLTVQSFQQGSLGTLAIDIRGTTVDTQYDRLAVTGTAQLGGKLKVSLINAFQPAAAQSFTVMTASSIIGFFDSLDLPTLQNGLVWDVAQGVSAYTLTVVRADYNENGVVDAADYALWRNTLGSVVPLYTAADGDGSGTINLNDFLVWKNHFGLRSANSSGSGSGGAAGTGVPEPVSTLQVLIAGGMLTLVARRRGVTRGSGREASPSSCSSLDGRLRPGGFCGTIQGFDIGSRGASPRR